MGIMESFNNFTSKVDKKLNELGAKAGEKTSDIINNNGVSTPVAQHHENEGSLEGLGNIPTASNTQALETPGSRLYKADTDDRKLATYMTNFASDEDYTKHLENWFITTGMFNVCDAVENTKQEIGITNITMVQPCIMSGTPMINTNLIIIGITDNKLKNVLDNIAAKNINTSVNRIVIVGFNDYTVEDMQLALSMGVDIIDSEAIREINNAVDSADAKMPYIKTGNKLHNILAECINSKYRGINVSTVSNQGIVDKFNSVTSSIDEKLNGL